MGSCCCYRYPFSLVKNCESLINGERHTLRLYKNKSLKFTKSVEVEKFQRGFNSGFNP